jgi:hypothetical protein
MIFNIHPKRKNNDSFDRKIHSSGRQITVDIIIGVFLIIVIIELQCVTFLYPIAKKYLQILISYVLMLLFVSY